MLPFQMYILGKLFLAIGGAAGGRAGAGDVRGACGEAPGAPDDHRRAARRDPVRVGHGCCLVGAKGGNV